MRPARPRSTAHGFTLIEISVVLVIVGILASLVALSITNRPLAERQKFQADRLYQLLRLAAEQAQLQSTEIGLVVGLDGYRFVTLDATRHWIPYGNGPLRTRRLPPSFKLRLHIDQHAITAQRLGGPVTSGDGTQAGANDDGDNNAQVVTPQILLLSSGETTAFQLDITATGSGMTYRIAADELGHFTIKQENG